MWPLAQLSSIPRGFSETPDLSAQCGLVLYEFTSVHEFSALRVSASIRFHSGDGARSGQRDPTSQVLGAVQLGQILLVHSGQIHTGGLFQPSGERSPRESAHIPVLAPAPFCRAEDLPQAPPVWSLHIQRLRCTLRERQTKHRFHSTGKSQTRG